MAVKQQIATSRPQLFSVGCLQPLLQTLYLGVGPDVLKRAHQLEYHLEILLRGGNHSKGLLQSMVTEIEALADGISKIRSDVARGEFSEPTTVSMMSWLPTENHARVQQETGDSDSRSCAIFFESESSLPENERKRTGGPNPTR